MIAETNNPKSYPQSKKTSVVFNFSCSIAGLGRKACDVSLLGILLGC